MRVTASLFSGLALICFGFAAESQDTPLQKKGDAAVFRTSVDQVVLYVSVYGTDNQLVSDLVAQDFSIFENKVQQEMTYFGLDDVPSTIGIVMDSSGSMRGKVELVNGATSSFLNMNNPQNELFLVEFKDEVSLEEDFTRDPEDIRDSLDNIIISGGTALYDAIYLGVEKARQGAEPKRALLVFTDGEDKDSFYEYEDVLEKIQEAEVQIYVVAFLDSQLSQDKGFFGLFKSERQKVEREITTLAETTGAKAFFPTDIKELDDVFATIAREIRNQYRLAFVSSNKVLDGSWRQIDVVVKGAREKGLKVRSKKGYYAK